ncbi:MAG: SDR family NAD(P)-dependent oxidoreductase [Chloroflexota bacterium]|nr:SDR family oxidoreductase [Dehalococcoidia bacterium]MDW8254982.1 SDR family NAD(P)-dependent oxidoreductase [Chloroflexota bacterium]
MRVGDKVALVTGAGKGIGEAIALRLAEEGADVVVNDIDRASAEKTAAAVRAKGRRALVAIGDVANFEDVRAVVDQALGELGRVDILVNNAGIFIDKSIFRMEPQDFERVLRINLFGAWNFIKCVVPGMRERRYGKIVNISSRAMLGNPGQSNYSASKAGLVGMTRALALELGKFNINVNAVAPGAVMTDLLRQTSEENIQRMLANTPLGRIGEPIDIANAVLFLASDEASYITGQTLIVCGGRSLGASNL